MLARYFTEKLKPRPGWVPAALSAYTTAEEHAGRDLVMLAKPLVNPTDLRMQDQATDEFIKTQLSQRCLATFFPLLSVFTGVKAWEKTGKFVYITVRMMSMLKEHMRVARTDPAVTCYTPKEWRGILEGGLDEGAESAPGEGEACAVAQGGREW